MAVDMFYHTDALADLQKPNPAKAKLDTIHKALQETYDFIDRISVSLYDDKTTMLRTFIFSEEGWEQVAYYEASLTESITLQEIVKLRRPRVVNDLSIFDPSEAEHVHIFKARQYQSSYTVPMIFNDDLWGFIFFDSPFKNSFTEGILDTLDVYGHLISLVVFRELNSIRVMLAFFDLLINVVHEMDPETGDHIERVSRYTRLIALELAKSGEYNLTDEDIEYMSKFAGLHDLGKMIIPDNILFKPGKLDDDEWEIMRTHASYGAEIAEDVVKAVGFLAFTYDKFASSIPNYHHENVDGSGYPYGLEEEDIPLESRIVAAADVFDALTSDRPYKTAWTNADAFAEMYRIADSRLDRRCVQALEMNQKEIEKIKIMFPD